MSETLVNVLASGPCQFHPEQATCGAPSKAVGHFVCALANVPDGWAKIGGEWVRLVQHEIYGWGVPVPGLFRIEKM